MIATLLFGSLELITLLYTYFASPLASLASGKSSVNREAALTGILIRFRA